VTVVSGPVVTMIELDRGEPPSGLTGCPLSVVSASASQPSNPAAAAAQTGSVVTCEGLYPVAAFNIVATDALALGTITPIAMHVVASSDARTPVRRPRPLVIQPPDRRPGP
jgi:hypothetical protein